MNRFFIAVVLKELLAFVVFVGIMRLYRVSAVVPYTTWERFQISAVFMLLSIGLASLSERVRMNAVWKSLDEETKGTGDSLLIAGIGGPLLGAFLFWVWWVR